ncbi:MAG: NAD(P)H-dependent oxidoreductase [Actinobacteria bacterium]|nr:NAD(P)H-dependent oxidoreductase [Actinomycetota bacterium]
MRILGLAGSLRAGSHNAALLGAAALELPSGVELDVWPDLATIPPYDEDEDVEPAPAPVARMREALVAADTVLIATPEYNHSIPGQLKNALDWASRPYPDSALRGKPVAVIGASASLFGAVWAQAELRKVLGAMGAHVVGDELPVGLAGEAFDADGRLSDPALRERLAAVILDLHSAWNAAIDLDEAAVGEPRELAGLRG